MLKSLLRGSSADLTARLAEVRTRKKKSLGLTLVETLLAIAIGAGVIIATVAFYLNAAGGNQVNEANGQVQTIVSGVRTLYSSTNSYASLNNGVAVQARIFPPTMVRAGTTTANAANNVINPWKGLVVLAGTANSFTVQYQGVPQDACAKLISTNNIGMGAGLLGISVGAEAQGSEVAPPIDPGQAITLCSSSDNNWITYHAR